MSIRSEKQFRAEHEGKYAPATIDLLVKAEREAGKLKASLDDDEEDEDDEAKAWDEHGDMVAKARQQSADALAKAATIKVDTITVSDPTGYGSPDPVERYSAERSPVDPDIDDVTMDDVTRDIVKAVDDVLGPRMKAQGATLVKAFGEGLKRVVERVEARFASQDARLDAVLAQNTMLTKAARKQEKASRSLAKALDITPAVRKPAYSINDVVPLPRPGDPPTQPGRINADDLSEWLGTEIAKAAESRDLPGRQRVEKLYSFLAELDAGTRPLDQIAASAGFNKN